MEQRRQTTRGERVSHRGLLLVKLSPIALIALVIAGVAHAPGVVIGTLAVLMFALYLAGLGSLVAGVFISRGELMSHLRKIAAGDAPHGTAGHHSDSMTAQLQQENREQASTALAAMSSEPLRSLKQMGLLVLSAFSFWAVLFSFGITATTSLHDSAGGIVLGIGFTLGSLVLFVWPIVVVVRMVRKDYRRHQEQAAPLVAAIEERNKLVPPRQTTILRVAPLRWLIAELIPFGFLAIGVLPGAAWHPIAGIFVAISLFASLFVGMPFSFIYLYKVHGTSAGWALPIILVYLCSLVMCVIATGQGQTDNGSRVVVTGALLIATAVLLTLLAVMIAGSVVTGERWVRRNQLKIAPNEATSRVLPYGNRGISSWMWLPRQPGVQHDGASPADSL
jgi:hypothetical protein